MWATSYFISPTGNDGNNGTSSGTPWLSPNHAVNCGDTITAAVGAYSAANFTSGKWGTVTCAGNNNVAWLTCATFDACTISSSTIDGMKITASYWGVQGWETTTTAGNGACFAIVPPTSGATIHHIILANNIANGCQIGGFNAFSNNPAGVDYLAFLGNISYNGAQGSLVCASGFNLSEPTNSDTLPGTHIYWAGNFSWNNLNPTTCNAQAATDGNGFILDTVQGNAYTGQIAIVNNLAVFNGARGIEVLLSQSTSPNSKVYVLRNTSYFNSSQDSSGDFFVCSDMLVGNSYSTEMYLNLAVSRASSTCGGNTAFTFLMNNGDTTDHVYNNYGFTTLGSGNFTLAAGSGGFAFGPSNTFSNPAFAAASDPSAPSCGSASSVPNCMATVIANFTPTVTAATKYGYQIPTTVSVYDPLYPKWLCTVTNLPTGLVTPGCTNSAFYFSGGNSR